MCNDLIEKYKLEERRKELSFLKDRLNFAIDTEVTNLKDLPRMKRLILDTEEKINKDIYKDCVPETDEISMLLAELKSKLKITKKKLKYLKYGKDKASTRTT